MFVVCQFHRWSAQLTAKFQSIHIPSYQSVFHIFQFYVANTLSTKVTPLTLNVVSLTASALTIIAKTMSQSHAPFSIVPHHVAAVKLSNLKSAEQTLLMKTKKSSRILFIQYHL